MFESALQFFHCTFTQCFYNASLMADLLSKCSVQMSDENLVSCTEVTLKRHEGPHIISPEDNRKYSIVCEAN